MSTQNLYLKQIRCLESPTANQDWHEIARHYPAVLRCLAEAEPRANKPPLSLHAKNDREEQLDSEDPINDAIPWCDTRSIRQDDEDSTPLQLKAFAYDCRYLSPFVSNLYSRERSAKGWYRWVGPDPILDIRIPLAPAEAENWIFIATFHSFLDSTHAQSICFKVNGKRKPLEWLEGLAYQSTISSGELYCNASQGETALALLSISVPEARRASEEDQRLLAFAIRELSLLPAQPL